MRAGFVLATLLLPSVAWADHHGMTMAPDRGGAASFSASLSLLAASFSTTSFVGDYQGAVPALTASMKQLSVGASLPLYRLQKNGLATHGPGDLVVHGQTKVVARGHAGAGALLALSVPTGDGRVGLGMGHAMLMPAGWAFWHHDRVMIMASTGYGRALTTLGSHHDHGPWPIVEPMNMSELTWSANADVSLAPGLGTSLRMSGGVPVGGNGHDRVVGAVRVSWSERRVDTAAELQAGIAGDPFNVRGVVETTVHF